MDLRACSCADKPEVAQPLKYQQEHFWGTTPRPVALAREVHTSSFLFFQGNMLNFEVPLSMFPSGSSLQCLEALLYG